MLSILIPCYNYNAVSLVNELYKQAIECKIHFEILVYDDASKSLLNTTNKTINTLKFCTFKALPKNLGRSKIRNKLAQDASFDNLLFLDVDTYPKSKNFIKNYLDFKALNLVYGNVTQKEKAPLKPLKLRWLYTKKRESNAFSSANFFIKKSVFLNFPFDASISLYGYEDVLFFKTLKANTNSIKMINNSVYHNDICTTKTYLKKVKTALKNLILLTDNGKISKKDSKIYYHFLVIQQLRLVGCVSILYKIFNPLLIQNFNSNYPYLLLFDFYRLGYFCHLKTKS